MIGFWPTPCLSRRHPYESPRRHEALEDSFCGVPGPSYANRFCLRLEGWPSMLDDPERFYGTWEENMDCRKKSATVSVGNFV